MPTPMRSLPLIAFTLLAAAPLHAQRVPAAVYTDPPHDASHPARMEVLHIPSNVPHKAEALEDTLDVDVFSPPRQDWLDKTDSYLRK